VPSDCLLTVATLERVGASTLNGRPLLFTAAGAAQIALCRLGMLDGLDLGGLTAGGAENLWAALRARGAEGIALDGEVCARITDARSVALAEAALCERLRADSAASDGPLAHYVDRRVSLWISRWLVGHTQLRPNHITVIGTSVGLLAAALLSVGTYWSGVGGTLLFLCATIIDGCDGEVARLKFQESSFGQKFDVITDNVVHVAIFVGLAVGLYHQSPDGHYLLLMGILLGGFTCTSVVTYFFLVRRPGFASSGGAPVSWRGKVRQRLLRGFEALMNRDFAYLLAVLAVIDRLYWFMWGTAFGTYVFAILLVWIYRWRDAA
jgi:phosphatidylglycerophosphate synthase